jgi:hypothetical protein
MESRSLSVKACMNFGISRLLVRYESNSRTNLPRFCRYVRGCWGPYTIRITTGSSTSAIQLGSRVARSLTGIVWMMRIGKRTVPGITRSGLTASGYRFRTRRLSIHTIGRSTMLWFGFGTARFCVSCPGAAVKRAFQKSGTRPAIPRRGPADRGQRGEAAGAITRSRVTPDFLLSQFKLCEVSQQSRPHE